MGMLERAKQVIYDYIKEHNCTVSFAELEHLLEEHGLVKPVPEGKSYVWEILDKNIVIWASSNTLVIDATIELFEEKKIGLIPAPILVYIIDGKYLRLPLVKQNKKYKTPHWLPSLLCIYESAIKYLEKEGRRGKKK